MIGDRISRELVNFVLLAESKICIVFSLGNLTEVTGGKGVL